MENYNIWLTTMCTLKCKYCYEKNTIEKHMNLKTAQKVIEYLEKEKKVIESVNFHGGEPLLNNSILSYLTEELVKRYPNIHLGFTTNGTIWNDEIKQLLKKYKTNFSSGISISIDGKEDVHDKNRYNSVGNGSYHLACDTLSELQTIFEDVRGRMTVTKETSRNIFISVKHLYEKGIKTIAHAFDFFNKEWTNEDIEIIKEEYEKTIEFWKEKRDCRISFSDGLNFRNRELARCNCSPNIYIDGVIYPCMYMIGENGYEVGDIETGLDKPKIEKYKEDILYRDNPFCEPCTYKNCCINNRCKFMNMAITGDYYTPAGIACAIENIENAIFIKYKEILK